MKPVNIILDLLRTYMERGTSVANIMATGAMFGCSENQMRVNLSRLTAKGSIVNFARGAYRLAETLDPVSDFIESWRLGEGRTKPWTRTWLLAASSASTDANNQNRHHWALHSHGFRPASSDCWIRPDNLALTHQPLAQRLLQLGVSADTVLASNANINARWQEHWQTQFNPASLTQSYLQTRDSLIESMATLPRLPKQTAMKETFYLGGHAIQVLAKDPLLPAEFLDSEPRHALWRAMLDYDRMGRELWADAETNKPYRIPTAKLAFQ